MRAVIAGLYDMMDKRPLRALSLVLALVMAGCILWDPSRVAAKTSSLSLWQGLLLIWAICTGVIHGVGFHPQRLRWQALFTPLPALLVLLAGLSFWFL
ncbi:cyd operon protein YbgE [Pantoea sp. 1.19]|uniref:cyd operon protein YbgE n=1 Tax=Pantoea sp. 1.19 TaxID=1925589 RepID=UPI0009489F70|nr:cyd operon protein YbgE [Pantoea sp. 1.19]